MSRYTSVVNKTVAFGLQTPAADETCQQYAEQPDQTTFVFSEHKPAVPAELILRRSLPTNGSAKNNLRTESRVRKGFIRADLSVGLGVVKIETSFPSDMPDADRDRLVARAIGSMLSSFYPDLVKSGAV